MERMAGYSSRGTLWVQSPVAETSSMGRGAIMAAISTLEVPMRSPGAFSHWQPPCMMNETMFTGAATRTRSSTAASKKACVAPPEAPATAIRWLSTSGSDSTKSSARIEFHNCRPSGVKLQS